jgi:hypothetical protein
MDRAGADNTEQSIILAVQKGCNFGSGLQNNPLRGSRCRQLFQQKLGGNKGANRPNSKIL